MLSFSLSSNSVKLGKGTLFGIGPESEELSPVEAVLNVGSTDKTALNIMLHLSYKILEVCILEVRFSQYSTK